MAITRLTAAVAAVSAILMGGPAHAETWTTIATSGEWNMDQVTHDDGNIGCLLLTNPVNRPEITVGIIASGGMDQLRVNVRYANWSTPKSFVTRLDFAFDDIHVWGKPDNARAELNHVATWVGLQATPEFVHEFTAGSTMRVTVAGAAPLSVSLSGTTAIWGAFMDCAKQSSPALVAAITGMAPPFVAAAPAPAPVQTASTEVALVTHYGVKHVQGIAGRATSILFVLDSGSGDLTDPPRIGEFC